MFLTLVSQDQPVVTACLASGVCPECPAPKETQGRTASREKSDLLAPRATKEARVTSDRLVAPDPEVREER